jgi:hypothetical protein
MTSDRLDWLSTVAANVGGVLGLGFLDHDSGVVDDRDWTGFDAWYATIVRAGPGDRYGWAESRHGFAPRFQQHVDRVLAPGS